MNKRCFRVIIPAALSLLVVVTGFAGGWSTVSFEDLPEYFVAGKPVSLTFLVRAHGVTLVDGLAPGIRAVSGGNREVKAIVSPGWSKGRYTALLTFPRAGEWTFHIENGWAGNTSTLLPMKVIAPGSPMPSPLSQIARGERLFVEKGCMGCHRNEEVAARNLVSIGPDLTGKVFPADYLRKFLADPPGMLGKASPPVIGQMPNLDLAGEDIAAIGAFINRERPAVKTAKGDLRP